MDRPSLPADILRSIMEVSPRPTVAEMTRTCRTLRVSGVRFLLSGDVSFANDWESFMLFLNADPCARFPHLHSLELPHGLCPSEAADALLEILAHPSLALYSLTLRSAESFLWSTPTPSESSPSPNCADQATFVVAFAGLTTLRHFTLEQCGYRARRLLNTLRSPLQTVHVGFPAYTFWPNGSEKDRNLISLLANVANSLEELSGANIGDCFDLTDAAPVYPSVQRLNVEMYSHRFIRYPFYSVIPYITAFPNLTHLSLISENSDGSFMGCVEACSRLAFDNRHAIGDGKINNESQERLGQTWKHLEEVAGGLNEVLALGLACHVPRLRLTGGISCLTLKHVPTILKGTRPTYLAITIIGVVRHNAVAALFRDPFAQQLQNLEVTLCFSIDMESVGVKALMKNMIRSIGSLPALRNFVLTLNCGLVSPPNEAYRARRGWSSRIERIVDKLDLDAWAVLFLKAIPTLVDVAVRRSKDRTPRDSKALFGSHWDRPNL